MGPRYKFPSPRESDSREPLKRAGLTDFHFHDLRHEAISRFFESGLTVPEVALISGHRDVRMLLRYTHPMRSVIMKKLDNALGPTT